MKKTIVICTPGNSFTGKFLTSLTYLIRHLSSKGFNVLFSTTYSRNIYEVRNKCLMGKPERVLEDEQHLPEQGANQPCN